MILACKDGSSRTFRTFAVQSASPWAMWGRVSASTSIQTSVCLLASAGEPALTHWRWSPAAATPLPVAHRTRAHSGTSARPERRRTKSRSDTRAAVEPSPASATAPAHDGKRRARRATTTTTNAKTISLPFCQLYLHPQTSSICYSPRSSPGPRTRPARTQPPQAAPLWHMAFVPGSGQTATCRPPHEYPL